MIVEQTSFNKKDFLDLFQKRFFSFCEKSPLFLRFTLMDDRVLVYDMSVDPKSEPFEYMFDFQKDEKMNIKAIKDYLVENNYPVIEIINEVSRQPNALEIQDIMVRDRLSFRDAAQKSIVKTDSKKYRVEKILNQDNKVIIRDLQDNNLYIYSVKIPVTIFVRELFINEANAADIFSKKCERQKQVTDIKSLH
jgi:hypothetical protein